MKIKMFFLKILNVLANIAIGVLFFVQTALGLWTTTWIWLFVYSQYDHPMLNVDLLANYSQSYSVLDMLVMIILAGYVVLFVGVLSYKKWNWERFMANIFPMVLTNLTMLFLWFNNTIYLEVWYWSTIVINLSYSLLITFVRIRQKK